MGSPDTSDLSLVGVPPIQDLATSPRILGQGQGEEERVGGRKVRKWAPTGLWPLPVQGRKCGGRNGDNGREVLPRRCATPATPSLPRPAPAPRN